MGRIPKRPSQDPSSPLLVWRHGHDGEYRQLPCRDPRHAYVLLLTPQGPTPWSSTPVRIRSQHLVLHPIGERLGPAVHYVGSFSAFEDCRRQPPKVQQRGQGVLISFEGEYHRAHSERSRCAPRSTVGWSWTPTTYSRGSQEDGWQAQLPDGQTFQQGGPSTAQSALRPSQLQHTRRRQSQLIRPRGFEGHRPTLSTHDGPWALGSP